MKYHHDAGARKSPLTPLCKGGTHEGRERLQLILSKRRYSLNRKGIVLIASIMLIVFVTIAVLGVTTFIIQRLSQDEANRINTKCVYLAQAGIHKAIYEYRVNDSIVWGKTNIDAANFFVLDGAIGDLLVTVKSTGKTTESDIYRTIHAVYDILTEKITGYKEIDDEITP